MKITRNRLRQIIKEELSVLVLEEAEHGHDFHVSHDNKISEIQFAFVDTDETKKEFEKARQSLISYIKSKKQNDSGFNFSDKLGEKISKFSLGELTDSDISSIVSNIQKVNLGFYTTPPGTPLNALGFWSPAEWTIYISLRHSFKKSLIRKFTNNIENKSSKFYKFLSKLDSLAGEITSRGNKRDTIRHEFYHAFVTTISRLITRKRDARINQLRNDIRQADAEYQDAYSNMIPTIQNSEKFSLADAENKKQIAFNKLESLKSEMSLVKDSPAYFEGAFEEDLNTLLIPGALTDPEVVKNAVKSHSNPLIKGSLNWRQTEVIQNWQRRARAHEHIYVYIDQIRKMFPRNTIENAQKVNPIQFNKLGRAAFVIPLFRNSEEGKAALDRIASNAQQDQDSNIATA